MPSDRYGSGLPSVTEVLVGVGLVDAAWFTEDARDRGSAVHVAANYLDANDLDDASLDPAVAPRLNQYRRFLTEVRPEILAVEEYVRYEGAFDGRLDRRLRIAGVEGILDIKGTCEAAWHSLQLVGYCATFTRPLKRWNLYLRDDSYRLVERGEARDRSTFLSALTLYEWKQRHAKEYPCPTS